MCLCLCLCLGLGLVRGGVAPREGRGEKQIEKSSRVGGFGQAREKTPDVESRRLDRALVKGRLRGR